MVVANQDSDSLFSTSGSDPTLRKLNVIKLECFKAKGIGPAIRTADEEGSLMNRQEVSNE